MKDLVLLHGWAMSPRVWEPVLPTFAEGCRVHNLALPGPGGARRWTGSGFPSAQALLDRWSDDCLARAPARAVWLGWSLGALIAMNAALRSPGHIGALVLISATPKFLEAPDWKAGVKREVMGDFLGALQADNERALKRFVLLQANGSVDPRAVARALMAALADRSADVSRLRAGLEILEQVDLRPRLAAVRPPALVIHGACDRVVPPAAGRHLADAVPGAEFLGLEAGHAPFVSRPREFAQAVRSWM